jgi:glycerol-3-phosphate dehydrogenase (NAD(P)+)
MHSVEEIIVIGSGNWGLALASLFSKHLPVRVWAIDQEMADRLNQNRQKADVWHKHPIPDRLIIQAKYAVDFDEDRVLIVLAVPSSQIRSAARELARHSTAPLILSVSKGFDVERQCTMSDVIRGEIPHASVVVLTGPTIANEVAAGLPTRAVLASEELTSLALVKECLRNDVLSFEVSRNPAHHEICAALKGIVAIAVGIADGLGLGTNAQGVLMTAGLREMALIGSFFGIPESVAYGISGAGDLITTCISPDSRNRRLGALLAQGLTLEQALEKVRMTVEGVAMSRTIETLWSLDVSIPLIHLVNAILRGESRDIRAELTNLIATF